MSNESMRLYVWANPFSVPYGTSMCISVAASVEEAKLQAEAGFFYSFVEYDHGTLSGIVLGEPTRIVDLPCAEWHEWSE